MSMENPQQTILSEEEQERLAHEEALLVNELVKKQEDVAPAIELVEEQKEIQKQNTIKEKENELEEKFKAGGTKEELGALEEERDRLKKEVSKEENKEIKLKEQPEETLELLDYEKKDQLMIGWDGEKDKEVKTPENIKNESRAGNIERLGFKEVSFRNVAAKGFVDTVGSVFGALLTWELPKLVSDIFKKKGLKGAVMELLDEVTENNKGKETDAAREKQAQEMMTEEQKKASEEREKDYGEEIKSKPIQDKIAAFNEKLKNVKLSEKEKQELRDQMALVLKEHRHSTEKLSEQKVEKVGKVFDVYANNSAQAMTVAKEAVNTASIFTMMPWLRGVGYTALSGVDSIMNASNTYDKKHFNDLEKAKFSEKLSFIAKNLTVDSAKETYNGLVGNFYKKNEKGEIMGFGKALVGSALKAMSLGGGALRLAGVAEFEHALSSGNLVMKDGAEKFVEALKGGHFTEALKQGGENWKNNAERLLSFVHLSENPDKAMNSLVKGSVAEKGANLEPSTPKIEGPKIESEKINELATIHKGEGVTHAFERQIENDPKAFGFKGDISDKLALHKFASNESYKIAVDNGYIDLKKGVEIRVNYDSSNPTRFILDSNKAGGHYGVQEVGAKIYVEDTKELARKSLEKANNLSHDLKNMKNLDHIKDEIEKNNREIEKLNIEVEKEARHRLATGSGSYHSEKLLNKIQSENESLVDKQNEIKSHFHNVHKNIVEDYYKDQVINSSVAEKAKAHLDEVKHNISENNKEIGRLNRADLDSPSHDNTEKLEHARVRAEALAQEKGKLESHDDLNFKDNIPKAHEEVIAINNKSKMVFSYNDKHEIVGMKSNFEGDSKDFIESQKLLKKDWFATLRSKLPTKDLFRAESAIKLNALDIYEKRMVLNQLGNSGRGNGPEAEMLKKSIAKAIKTVNEKYGNIF